MAKTNQTFKAVLKLQAEQFKKEANSVKKTLGSLQKSFMGFAASLGASLGFAQLISSMRRTTLELSTARATLENVSRETKTFTDGVNTASVTISNYAENLAFVNKLAKEYKQDIITLTDSFAKFSAAATTANVNMDSQREIFESLTKAATFFHMSGERTQQVMIAIEQMFSKGKVTSEELRRQLGNNLPGAFGLMAKAIGVSNAELDKMMKNGEVLASDALPKFAKELNKVTGNINLDSVQLAQNDLKNAWVGFVDSSGFENLYKKILAITTNFLNKLTSSFNQMSGLLIGFFGGGVLGKAFKKGLAQWDDYAKGVERNIGRMKKQYETWNNSLRKDLNLGANASNGDIQNKIMTIGNPALQQKYARSYRELLELEKQIKAETASIGRTTTVWGKALRGVQKGLQAVWSSIKAIASTMVFTALFAAIGSAIGAIIDYTKAIKQARNAVNDFNREVDDIKTRGTAVGVELKAWVSDLEKLNAEGKQGSQEWLDYLGRINELFRQVGASELDVASGLDEIKKKVSEWLEISEKVQLFNFATEAIGDAELELKRIQKELDKQSNKQLPNMFKVIRLTQEQEAQQAILAAARQMQEENKVAIVAMSKVTGNTITGGTKQSDFSKTVEKQKQALKELENQFKAGALSEKEYKDKLNDLVVSTFEAITAFDGFANKLKSMGEADWFDKIASQFALIKLALEDSEDAIEDYDKAMSDLGDTLYDNFKKNKDNKYTWSQTPDRGNRDTTFDYKKTKSSILGEELDLTKAQLDYVTEAIEKAREKAKEGITDAAIDLANLQNQLKGLQKEMTDLNDKMILAQLQEDIANYQKQMFDGVTNGIKSTATAMDRLVTSTKNLFETMNNPDASAWEQIMAIFNQIVQVFDTITGLIELFNTLSTLSNTLTEAKQVMNAKQLAMKEQEIGLVGALSTAEVAEGAAAAQAAMLKAGAYKVSQAALTNMAFAAGAGNAMAVPYPANLAALASNQAAITEMILAGKALQAFAQGGIVGGNSTTGDRNLVRVNSGELILNKAQQGNLFSLLNGKGTLGGGQVEFIIKGDKLWGTLQNYNNKKRG